MKPTGPLVVAFGLLLGLAAHPVRAQHRDVPADRAAFDAELREPNTSLLDPRIQAVFDGLPYFPVDPLYRVAATFTPTPGAAPFAMPTSAGTEQHYVEAGVLRFTLDGEPLVLHAYRGLTVTTDSLFVPFRDATSGTESYGGGRYLYLPFPVGEVVTLDFNTVTNPYCAYDPGYACPLPPEENTLPVPVRAGEQAPPAAWLEALLAPLPADWPLRHTPLRSLRIAFPYPPEWTSTESDAAPDREALVLSVDTLYLAASVMTAPEVLSPRMQEALRDRALAPMADQGTVEAQRADTLDGVPATRLTVRVDGRRIDALVATTERWVVVLVAPSSLADRFFGSAAWATPEDTRPAPARAR